MILLTFGIIFFVALVNGINVRNNSVKFPSYFKFGTASSAYQIEGAWNANGKGPSIWDTTVHRQPNFVADESTGNDAAKSYLYYKDDVAAVKEMGMNYYRFSISWPRIMPTGDTSKILEAGLKYYDNLIDELLANGIEPMITMYHWDLPQTLQDLGGWTNPLIVDYFVEYARVVFKRYADRVQNWITFNEPFTFCEGGYGDPWGAPHIRLSGVGGYLCSHHVLIAHAKAYRLYRTEFYGKNQAKGSVGIAINCNYAWPKNATDSGDVAAAQRALQFSCGWYAHPIFSQKGGYPDVMVENIDRKSHEEGRSWSRLPTMTDDLKELIRGSADFLGINYYTAAYAAQPRDYGEPSVYASYWLDMEVSTSSNFSWPRAKSLWLYSVPEGLRGLLNWFKDEYNNPKVIITENGWSDDGELNDTGRIDYLKVHLEAVLDAIHIDGCNVVSHTTWSIIDNFEWMMGYTERFGLYHIDFNDPRRKRTPKESSKVLRNIIKKRTIS